MIATQPPDSRLLYIGHLEARRGWKMKSHHHPFHELIVIIKGRMEVKIEGEVHQAKAGDLLLYLAGKRHEEHGDLQAPVESFFLSVEGTAWEQFPLKLKDLQGRVLQMAQWIYQDRNAITISGKESRATLLSSLLAEMIRLQDPAEKESSLATLTRAYIQAHLNEAITLDDLARHSELSKFHFCREYQKRVGCTPMAMVREIRLNHARHLLLSTDLPIKEIAPRCGIGDEYQLSHLIRKHYQMPPGQLRRRK